VAPSDAAIEQMPLPSTLLRQAATTTPNECRSVAYRSRVSPGDEAAQAVNVLSQFQQIVPDRCSAARADQAAIASITSCADSSMRDCCSLPTSSRYVRFGDTGQAGWIAAMAAKPNVWLCTRYLAGC
jgi:hypothetical protein